MKPNSNVSASNVFNLLFVIILGIVALYTGYFWYYLIAGIAVTIYRKSNSSERQSAAAASIREVSAGFAQAKRSKRNRKNAVSCYDQETKVTIDTWTLPVYLVYVGEHRLSLPHLIDPSLKIGKASSELKAAMGYWPSYDSIHENDRATYLAWLAGGRKDPKADVGLVFLYFYGLEARAIDEKKDHWIILTELVRLYKIYSGNGSFSRYCRDFMIWLIHENQAWTSRSVGSRV